MKKTYHFTLLFTLFLTILLTKPLTAFAGSNSADFGVQPIYPDNQEKNKSSYFSLLVKPGQTQTIKVKVSNYADSEKNVQVARNRATTANSGLIEYNDDTKEKHTSIQHDFNEMVNLKEDIIHLGPKESKEVDVNITVPKDEFEGIVLGGLHFSEVDDENQQNQDKQIKNTFSYSIPILLKMSDKKIENDVTLNTVTPTERNAHPFIEAQLVNSSSSVIQNMSVEGRIFNAKTNEEYYVNKENDLEMAPNSTLNFGFDLQNSPFLPGEYRILLKVVADGKEYEFEDTFKIQKQEAKEMNEQSAYVVEKEFPWLMISLLFGSVLLILIIMLVIIIRKKSIKTPVKQSVKKKKRKQKR